MDNVILGAIAAFFAVLFIFRLPAVWSATAVPQIDASFGSVWPYGRASRRGLIRATPAAALGVVAMIVAVFLMRVTGADQFRRGDPLTPAILVVWVFALIFLFAVVATLTIILFNRPKFLVPPPLPNERGMLNFRTKRRR